LQIIVNIDQLHELPLFVWWDQWITVESWADYNLHVAILAIILIIGIFSIKPHKIQKK